MMEFGYLLSDYLNRLDCTAKALADISGVSAIQLSRWRNGSRRPSDEMVRRIASGIAAMSDGALEREEVLDSLINSLPEKKRVGNGFGARLDQLMGSLKIRNTDVSRILNFDPSYLSRIRTGSRNPTSVEPIIDGVSDYIAHSCQSEGERAAVAKLTGASAAVLTDTEAYRDALSLWLRSGSILALPDREDVAAFLGAFESVEPDEYAIAFRAADAHKSPVPEQFPRARNAMGTKNLTRCIMDFFRATALSDSSERVLLYSDIPFATINENPNLSEKWTQALAKLIKKGLQIVIILDMNCPPDEIMLGLKTHIPLLMTDRIKLYYLKESNDGPFHHLLELSGAAALWGEAVAGHEQDSGYHLTYDPEEIRYYQKRAAALLDHSEPLMEIFTEDREAAYLRFLQEEKANGFLPFRVGKPAFRNVTVEICHTRWAVITKELAPRMRFLFRHPKILDAIERFNAQPSTDECGG